jgi:replicative DNA helicase
MDVQQALISKIVHEQAIVAAVNGRITTEFFTDDRYKRVFQFLLDHWQKYGTPADLAVVAQAFPSYDWPEYRQSIDYFMDALRQRRKRAILTECMGEGVRLLQTPDDPDAMDKMEEALRIALFQVRVETAPTLDTDLIAEAAAIDEMLIERMADPGFLRGITSGFNGIDYVTGGFQPEQFVVLIGLPKSLKSALLLYMAMIAHRNAQAPMFLGFEMSNREQRDRYISLQAGVSLTRVMHGTINEKERLHIGRKMREIEAMRSFVLSMDIENAMTVSGVQAKAMELQPDIIFIDGAYLMQSIVPKVEQGSASALTDIARSLKMLAQHMRIPIVVTTQASQTRSRGGKLTAESAMYTQAWRQSADVLLGVERVEQEGGPDDSGEVQIKVKVLDSRSGPRAETYVTWDWNKGKVVEYDPAKMAGAVGGDDG